MVGAPPDLGITNSGPRPSSTAPWTPLPSRQAGGTAENRYGGPMRSGGTAFPWHDLLPPPPQAAACRQPAGGPSPGRDRRARCHRAAPAPNPSAKTGGSPTPLPPGMTASKERRGIATPGAEPRARHAIVSRRRVPPGRHRPASPKFSGSRGAHTSRPVLPPPPRDGGAPGLPFWAASPLPDHQDTPGLPLWAPPGQEHTDLNWSSMETHPPWPTRR